MEDEVKSPWAWVLLGCAMGIVFSVICFFCVIKQNDDIQIQIKELTEKVQEHDEIMKAYEFFNWQYSLKMDTEDLEK